MPPPGPPDAGSVLEGDLGIDGPGADISALKDFLDVSAGGQMSTPALDPYRLTVHVPAELHVVHGLTTGVEDASRNDVRIKVVLRRVALPVDVHLQRLRPASFGASRSRSAVACRSISAWSLTSLDCFRKASPANTAVTIAKTASTTFATAVSCSAKISDMAEA